MKKTSLVYLLIITCVLAMSRIAAAVELPEVSEWQNGALRVTPFDTVSGNRGSWQERNYITTSGTRVLATWMEGAGEKGWAPPSESISASDGLMGSGATYNTITVAEEKAILESHSVTGLSVAVKITNKGTLTLESKYASAQEILAAAEKLTQLMK